MKKKKKPFHKVILSEMKAAAELASVSPIPQANLECLIRILRESIIPKGKNSEISEEIKKLAENFPHACSMTRSIQISLKKLAEEIKN